MPIAANLPSSAVIDCPGEIHDIIWIPEQDEVICSSQNSATLIICFEGESRRLSNVEYSFRCGRLSSDHPAPDRRVSGLSEISLATAEGQALDEISGLSLSRCPVSSCGWLYRLFSMDFIFYQVFL